MKNRKYEKAYAIGKVVPNKIGTQAKKNVKSTKMRALYANQIDVTPFTSIHVSTGANLNDDVFLGEELILALDTIANKPINIGHEQIEIRGHLMNAYPADKQGNEIEIALSKATAGFDDYHFGQTEAYEDGHNHGWTLVVDASGKLLAGYTTWDNGHRHFVLPSAAKAGKTSPGGVGNHTHTLLELPEGLIEKVVVASEEEELNSLAMPKDFDIISDGVLYSMIFPEEVSEVMSLAQEGKKFVSMETWFSGYDYLVNDKVVARNEETQFLDKCLRANGGNGHFDGKSVKRVLRNLIFLGQGIVDNPANPESIILAENNNSQLSQEEIENLNTVIEKNCVLDRVQTQNTINSEMEISLAHKDTGDKIMPETTEESVVTKLQAELDSAKAKLAELESVETANELAAAKAKAESLEATVATKETELTEAKAAVESVKAELETVKSQLAKATEELSGIKLEQILATRKNDLSDFDLTEADLAEILDEVKSMDDEAYAKFLSRANKLWKKKMKKEEEVEASTEEAAPAKDAEETVAEAATEELDTAIASKEPAINGSTESSDLKATAAKVVAEIFGTNDKETK